MKKKQTVIVILLLVCGIFFTSISNTFAQEEDTSGDAEATTTAIGAAGKVDTTILISELDKITEQSSSFNTDDFLQVGNEGSHTMGSGTDETSLLNKILKYIVQLVGTFGVFMMVIAGFFMVTSEGDDNRLQKGKNIFLYTIIGLLVAFTSYALIQFVFSVLFS